MIVRLRAFDERKRVRVVISTGWSVFLTDLYLPQDCDPKIVADRRRLCAEDWRLCGATAGDPLWSRLQSGVDLLGDGCDNQCNEPTGGRVSPDLVLQLGENNDTTTMVDPSTPGKRLVLE
jgi:hypothetical protein